MLSKLNLKRIFKNLAHNFRLNNIVNTIFSMLHIQCMNKKCKSIVNTLYRGAD